MAAIANVTPANTITVWSNRTNESFTRLNIITTDDVNYAFVDLNVSNAISIPAASFTSNTWLAADVITKHAIAANTITTGRLVDLSVTGAKLAAGAVSANTKIAAGVVTAHALAVNSVTTAKIVNLAVDGTKLAAGAVSANTKLAAGVVTRHAIAASAVDGGKLATGAVSANTKLGSLVITEHAYAALSISSGKIKDGAIVGGKIATAGISANTQFGSGVISKHAIINGQISPEKLSTTYAEIANANIFTADQEISESTSGFPALNMHANFAHGSSTTVARLIGYGRDSAANPYTTYAYIDFYAADNTNGSEDGQIRFNSTYIGQPYQVMYMDRANGVTAQTNFQVLRTDGTKVTLTYGTDTTFGTGTYTSVIYRSQSSTGVSRDMAIDDFVVEDATNTSEDSRRDLYQFIAGTSTNVLTLGNQNVAKRGSYVQATTLSPNRTANVTLDFANTNNWEMTLGGSITLNNPSNAKAGQTGSIIVKQDGTGSRVLSFGTAWKFPGGTAPTLTTTASASDRIDYYVANSTIIHAAASLDVS